MSVLAFLLSSNWYELVRVIFDNLTSQVLLNYHISVDSITASEHECTLRVKTTITDEVIMV